MSRARVFVIGLLMLWLPLQAIAAVSMPFCPHGGTGGVAQPADHEHHDHKHPVPDSSHHESQDGDHHLATGALQQCNNCGACNLACAPAVPVCALLIAGAALTVQSYFSAAPPGIFIPDRPQPPPNSSF
jgi:ferredoxin